MEKIVHWDRSMFVKFNRSGNRVIQHKDVKLDTTKELAYGEESEAELQRFCDGVAEP